MVFVSCVFSENVFCHAILKMCRMLSRRQVCLITEGVEVGLYTCLRMECSSGPSESSCLNPQED